jgi:hypothetical protein
MNKTSMPLACDGVRVEPVVSGFGRWFVRPRGAWRVACRPCNGIRGGGFFGVCRVEPWRMERAA